MIDATNLQRCMVYQIDKSHVDDDGPLIVDVFRLYKRFDQRVADEFRGRKEKIAIDAHDNLFILIILLWR